MCPDDSGDVYNGLPPPDEEPITPSKKSNLAEAIEEPERRISRRKKRKVSAG